VESIAKASRKAPGKYPEATITDPVRPRNPAQCQERRQFR